MIEANKITKNFSVTHQKKNEKITVLLSISLKIKEGEFVALVGPSGCGKSTFMEIIAGLQVPSEGEVYIDGKLVLESLPSTPKEMKAYKKRYRFSSPIANGIFQDKPKFDTAMIFQDYNIYPWMTVLQNILFTLRLRNVPKEEGECLARKYLNLVKLNGVENKYPSQLSGGMRQRVGLVRALSVEPKIIFMDEPFGAVDAFTRESLQDDLLGIWRGMHHKTIVFVTHDIGEAVYLADRVVIFSTQPGTVRDIISIDIPRPRKRTDKRLEDLKSQIFQIMS